MGRGLTWVTPRPQPAGALNNGGNSNQMAATGRDIPEAALRVGLTGGLDIHGLEGLRDRLESLPRDRPLVLDLGAADSVDTAAVLAVLELRDDRRAAGQSVEIDPGPRRARLVALLDEVVPLGGDIAVIKIHDHRLHLMHMLGPPLT